MKMSRGVLGRCKTGFGFTPWFLVRNGGMDPYDSPLRSPTVVPKTHSSPYSLLRTIQFRLGFLGFEGFGLGFRV